MHSFGQNMCTAVKLWWAGKVSVLAAVLQQKDPSDIDSLVSLPTIPLHNNWWLHERLRVQYKWPALRVSQSWWRTNNPLSVSVKAHLACHSNPCFVCKWYSWKRLKAAMPLRSFCRGTAVQLSGCGREIDGLRSLWIQLEYALGITVSLHFR